MNVPVPLSKLENKDEEVYYIRYRPNKVYYYLLILLFFIFICTLLGYIYTKEHDIGWLYINFLIGLAVMFLSCPYIVQLYVTCEKKKEGVGRIESDIEF